MLASECCGFGLASEKLQSIALQQSVPGETSTTFMQTESKFRNVRRRLLAAPLALLVVGGGSLEAEDLVGRILDPDGFAVINAGVTLVNRNSGELYQTVSSDNGNYEFFGLSEGRYILEAEAPDASLNGRENVDVSGPNTTVDLTVRPATSVTEIVVTATGTPLTQQEVAKTLDVVDAKEVNERDEYLLIEALRTVPGVQIQTQVGGVMSIKTRGLRNQDTAVLIDGLRFRDAAATQGDATGFFSDMNIVSMSQSEFLRGSGSSLYGSNAIAGALSVNSDEGGGPVHGAIRTEGGGLGMMRGTANLAGGFLDDKLVYSGGFSHLNVTRGVRGITPNRNTGGQFFSKLNLAPGISLAGRLWGSGVFQRSVINPIFPSSVLENFPATGVVNAVRLPNDQLNLFSAGQPFSAGNATFVPGVPDPDGSRSSSFLTGALIFKQELSATTSWRFSYQGVNTKRGFFNGPAANQITGYEPSTSVVSNYDGHTDLIQIRMDSAVGRHHLITAGFEMENLKFLNVAQHTIGTSSSHMRASQISQSYYGQDQMHFLGDSLQVTLGGRMQNFNLTTPQFTGSTSPYKTTKVSSPPNAYTGDVSVAYFMQGSSTKLRGHLGNSYRAPSLYERFGASVFLGQYSFYGDPRLAPERSVAFDTGIDQWLLHDKMRASATFFYTDLRETIIFNFANFNPNDPFGRFGGYQNTKAGGIARGAELSMQYSPSDKTSMQFGYTYTNSDLRNPTVANFASRLGVAMNTFTMTATQWLTPRLNLTFDYYINGKYPLSPYGANGRVLMFQGPKKADLVANYNIPLSEKKSVNIYGKVENMFNYDYTDSGFLAPGAWAIGGVRYEF